MKECNGTESGGLFSNAVSPFFSLFGITQTGGKLDKHTNADANICYSSRNAKLYFAAGRQNEFDNKYVRRLFLFHLQTYKAKAKAGKKTNTKYNFQFPVDKVKLVTMQRYSIVQCESASHVAASKFHVQCCVPLCNSEMRQMFSPVTPLLIFSRHGKILGNIFYTQRSGFWLINRHRSVLLLHYLLVFSFFFYFVFGLLSSLLLS